MEQNNESQKITEQLYPNIEENSLKNVSNISEETTYSIEGLHPELKTQIPEVELPLTNNETLKSNPTIINNQKETTEFQTSNLEQPSQIQDIQPTITSTENTLQPQDVQNPQQPKKTLIEQETPEEPDVKVFYGIFAIILLIVLVGLPLSTTIKNTFDSKTEEKTPKKEEPKSPSQTPPTPSNPNQINFNSDLTFDKGFVTDSNEINKRQGYTPTNVDGIIRCDLENPIVTNEATTYTTTYLHYEDHGLKSAITVTKKIYKDNNAYTINKDETQIYIKATEKQESLDIVLKEDDENFTLTNIMHYHLMYGHSTYIEELNKNITFSSIYTTNIKNAIDDIITKENNNGNIICGTLNTQKTES